MSDHFAIGELSTISRSRRPEDERQRLGNLGLLTLISLPNSYHSALIAAQRHFCPWRLYPPRQDRIVWNSHFVP